MWWLALPNANTGTRVEVYLSKNGGRKTRGREETINQGLKNQAVGFGEKFMAHNPISLLFPTHMGNIQIETTKGE